MNLPKFKVQRREKGWKAKRLSKNAIGYMKYKHVVCSDCMPDDKDSILWFPKLEYAIDHLIYRYNAKREDIKIEK